MAAVQYLGGPGPVDAVGGAGAHAPDAQNPAALQYALMKLRQLHGMGIDANQFGVTGDPTAQYRALSAILGARQANSAGHAAQYTAPSGLPPMVAQIIQTILGGGQPDTSDNVAQPAPHNPAVQHLSEASSSQMLHTLGRARAVAKAMQHLRQLRPASPQ